MMRRFFGFVRRSAAVRIAGFACLGLLVNAGLAWACALWSSDAALANVRSVSQAEVRSWIERSPRILLLRMGRSERGRAFGVEFTTIDSNERRPNYWHRARGIRAGWPRPSLYGERWIRFGDEDVERADAFVTAVDPARAGFAGEAHRARLLPLRPVLPGFVTNTIFYALAGWTLLRLPAWSIAAVRLARRRCTRCGTALPEGSDVCSSCGARRGVISAGADGQEAR